MQDPDHVLPRCRSHFQIVTPRPAFNVVAVIDQDDGAMSVTNDAENVVERLRVLGALRPGDRLVYRDSEGHWDEMAWDDRGFIGFRPLGRGRFVLTLQEATALCA